MLPLDTAVADALQNSIIGGATLWVLTGHEAPEYTCTAQFFDFISQREQQAASHQVTGFVPITTAACELTHDQVEAMSLANRIVLMNGGRIEQIGTPMALYDRPASRFVAEFIGTPPMNILPAESPAAEALSTRWRAPAETRWLGVRPEALQVTTGPGMAGEVVLIEALGADMLAHVLPDGLDAPIVLRAHAMAGLAERDRVTLAPEAGSLRAFDGAGRAVQPAAEVVALSE